MPVEVGDKVVAVATNGGAMFALTGGGALYGWGGNSGGRAGIDNGDAGVAAPTPVDVDSLVQEGVEVLSISAGRASSAVIAKDADGVRFATVWGGDNRGKATGIKLASPAGSAPLALAGAASGRFEDLFWTDSGEVYTYTPDGPTELSVFAGLAGTNVSMIEVGPTANIASANEPYYAVTTSGDLYVWGKNGDGQLGAGTFGNFSTPAFVQVTNDAGDVQRVIDAAPGDRSGLVLTEGGEYTGSGRPTFGMLGNGETSGADRDTFFSPILWRAWPS